jgi:hypothetical protein
MSVSTPLESGPSTQPSSWSLLRQLLPVTWKRALMIAAVAALAIGIPSDLIPNPVFGRPVPIRSIDYLIWVVTALLMGLVLAIRPVEELLANHADHVEDDGHDTKAMVGGFVSFLAVGCPVCNQLVVALVGTSGALSWWAPVQPIVGLLAVGILLYALRKRLRTYDLDSCPIR